MSLLEPKPFFKQAGELAALANNNWESLILPTEIIDLFCKSWKKSTKYGAIPANAQVRLSTSEANSEIVTHCDLAKAMVTEPLYKLLHEYRDLALKIADFHKIDTFKQEFKDKRTNPPPSWNLWSNVISQNVELTTEEKIRFETFLTNSDSFYGIKGIAREDFATPALCKSIDKRIDRFSICGDIAKATMTEPKLFDLVKAFLTQRSIKHESVSEFEIPSEEPRLRKLCLSVLTKPFLILTGPSGTGKTRGAVELAKLVCPAGCRELVAVGADWTDNRHVLGYLNPLETESAEAKRPIYETTAILDLILHANDPANLGLPHVLILDEMNLSHVERYFADFLSAMELEDKADALKLHAAGAAVTRTGKNIPSHINFPTNLFVIGTVNIDETTYMFSPKVLDRANVIEIHAEHDALSDFLRKTSPTVATPRVKDYGISFLDAAHVIQAKEETAHAMVPLLPPTVRDAAVDHLMALFRIMKSGRGEYGFRTGKEVMAYLRTAHFLAGPDEAARTTWATGKNWQDALDAQILQKILPKLHGSRSRLGPLLGALATYCASGEEAHAMEHFPTDGAVAKRTLQDARGLTAMKFKNSYEKLDRMISVLIEEQFVSFIC